MHEGRVTVPKGLSSDIARLAFDVGIDRVTVYPVLVLPDADADVVSVETSTPRAKAFLDRLTTSGLVSRASVTTRGPDQFNGFKSPLVSLALSLMIGIAAGLSRSDDTGRRYLIGVAAAAQSGVFPVWLGIALVLGFPDVATTAVRLSTLLLNIVSIGIAASISYGLMASRVSTSGASAGEDVESLTSSVRSSPGSSELGLRMPARPAPVTRVQNLP